MTTTTNDAYTLDPGTVYDNLDTAMKAASCLSGLHPDGATVYITTDPAIAPVQTGEAYVIACACIRSDGSTWPRPADPWEPVYTITRVRN